MCGGKEHSVTLTVRSKCCLRDNRVHLNQGMISLQGWGFEVWLLVWVQRQGLGGLQFVVCVDISQGHKGFKVDHRLILVIRQNPVTQEWHDLYSKTLKSKHKFSIPK